MEIDQKQLTALLASFDIPGQLEEAVRYGNGHINDTLAVLFTQPAGRYILQHINHYVFKKPAEVMENVERITSFLREKITAQNGDPTRETLRVIKTRDGKPYILDSDGNYWRMYAFIQNTISHDAVESAQSLYWAGRAFGHFQHMLSDFPAHTLYETIPFFHHTPKRYEALCAAIEGDVCSRAKGIAEEIAFCRKREADIQVIQNHIDSGALPLRVTHNDTKLNNVLFDLATDKPICVVDFDTVMPGSLLFDFGDAIRFGANTGAEDERDITKIGLNMEYYEAFRKGFLEEVDVTPLERELLPLSAKVITLECGIRFLTDYLNGDVYFHIDKSRPTHNLDRARTQFALTADIEQKLGC